MAVPSVTRDAHSCPVANCLASSQAKRKEAKRSFCFQSVQSDFARLLFYRSISMRTLPLVIMVIAIGVAKVDLKGLID